MTLPKTIPTKSKEGLPTILVDTREKLPYVFRASKNCNGSKIVTLQFGDYTIDGHRDLIVIERKKSVTELCGNIGKHRDRFERELEAMQRSKFKFIIVEDYWSSVFKKNRYSRMHPDAVLGSIVSLNLKYGVQFIFAGSRESAQKLTRRFLIKAYEYRIDGKV